MQFVQHKCINKIIKFRSASIVLNYIIECLKFSLVMLALICSILPYTWPIMLKINYAGIFGWSLNLIAMSNLKLMMNVKAAIWILRN